MARCPICGETAPTAELCIPKLASIAKPGEPCDYSLEGEARFAAEIGEEKATLVMAVLTPHQDGTAE